MIAGRLRTLWRDRAGATSAEFVLVIPLWFTLFFGMLQIAMFFWANAGLQHALGEGARVAAIFSQQGRTTEALTADIVARIEATRFGIIPDNMPDPVVTYATTPDGLRYADISVEYDAKLLLFNVPTLTLRGQQRVYLP